MVRAHGSADFGAILDQEFMMDTKLTTTTCIAGLPPDKEPMLCKALSDAGLALSPAHTNLRVADLRAIGPDFVLFDVDDLQVDKLEFVRQVRFVLPESILALYTSSTSAAWALSCHVAGINCMLCEKSSIGEIVKGLRAVMVSGCFTDRTFAIGTSLQILDPKPT